LEPGTTLAKSTADPKRFNSGTPVLIVALLCSLLAAAPALFGGSFSSAVETIHVRELRKHCEVLASDTLEGRETGTRGGQAAGAYIVDALRKQKVRPAGPDGDYYQPFPPSSRNILVVMPGSDRELKQEYIVVGAHYDHVGYGSARNSRGPVGYIHNGADDNASGAAGLLELVDAFSSLDTPPKRSILFAFWDAEEAGLLGSQYWIHAPTIPLDRIRLVFNIDMIGRLRQNRAEAYGSRTAPGLRELLSAQNVESPVLLNFPWETRRDSDHYNFYAQQIPYLMVFTGKHPEYHTPYDDVDKLNVDGMERITRLLFRAVYSAAQRPALAAFRSASFQEGSQNQQYAETPLALPPSRFGVTWDVDWAKRNVVQLVEVDAGSAAQVAGLQPGDRILELGGVPITTPERLREAVFSAPEQTSVRIERPSEKSPLELALRLPPAGDPFGVSVRIDDAEPGCVIVNRVVPGSPAYRAGLKLGDRLEKIGASRFASAEEFQSLLARARRSGAFEIETEHDGQPRTVRISLRAPTAAGKPGLVSPPSRKR